MASTCSDEFYETADSASFSDPPLSPSVAAAIPVVYCPPHRSTMEVQPLGPAIPFCILRPLTFLPRQPPPPVVTASPYRSPSPPPSCGCCRVMLGMAVMKGPKIMC